MAGFDLSTANTQLLVVDVQERLLPHIHEHERVLAQVLRIIRAAGVLQLPLTVCEQYPRGLGHSAPAVLVAAAGCRSSDGSPVAALHKLTFSAGRDPVILQQLGRGQRPQVLLAGIETHVCVQQTAWDLADAGLRPVIIADAVSSRREHDHSVALAGMRQAGILVTTFEAAAYRLMERAGSEQFKRVLELVK